MVSPHSNGISSFAVPRNLSRIRSLSIVSVLPAAGSNHRFFMLLPWCLETWSRIELIASKRTNWFSEVTWDATSVRQLDFSRFVLSSEAWPRTEWINPGTFRGAIQQPSVSSLLSGFAEINNSAAGIRFLKVGLDLR
jgi:hypothetical protein